MKNVLKKFEKGNTQFFIMKSFVYAVFEIDRKSPEYHIFYIKQNSIPEAYCQGYMNLKERKMNRKEIKYFKDNLHNYETVVWNEDGKVFNLKTRPFDTSQCPLYKQYMLSL